MARDVPGTWETGPPPLPQQIGKQEAASVLAQIEALGAKRARLYRMGECSIMLAHEPAGVNGEWLWHLSISHPLRHPTWDEIKAARYWLLPSDLTFGMLLPPPEHYINVEAQDHVMQLWEITDPREPWTAT